MLALPFKRIFQTVTLGLRLAELSLRLDSTTVITLLVRIHLMPNGTTQNGLGTSSNYNSVGQTHYKIAFLIKVKKDLRR